MTHDTESERGLPELPEPDFVDSVTCRQTFDSVKMRAYAIAAIEKDRASRPSPVAQDGDLTDDDIDGLWLENRPPGVSNEEQYRCARNFARAVLAAAPLSAPKADEEKP